MKAMGEDRKTLRAELEAVHSLLERSRADNANTFKACWDLKEKYRTELAAKNVPDDRLRSFVEVKIPTGMCPPFVDGVCTECGRMPHACECPAR